ncbi:hypothetical protein SARC_08194, partial [Sphaeroforma arctica JP610]
PGLFRHTKGQDIGPLRTLGNGIYALSPFSRTELRWHDFTNSPAFRKRAPNNGETQYVASRYASQMDLEIQRALDQTAQVMDVERFLMSRYGPSRYLFRKSTMFDLITVAATMKEDNQKANKRKNQILREGAMTSIKAVIYTLYDELRGFTESVRSPVLGNGRLRGACLVIELPQQEPVTQQQSSVRQSEAPGGVHFSQSAGSTQPQQGAQHKALSGSRGAQQRAHSDRDEVDRGR